MISTLSQQSFPVIFLLFLLIALISANPQAWHHRRLRQGCDSGNGRIPSSISTNGTIYRHASPALEIFTTLQIPCDGQISRWFYLSIQSVANGVYFSVWRPDNATAPTEYSLVGSTYLRNVAATGDGLTWNTIASIPPISVEANDVLGIFYDDFTTPPVVPISEANFGMPGDAAQANNALTLISASFANDVLCLGDNEDSSDCNPDPIAFASNISSTGQRGPGLVAALGFDSDFDEIDVEAYLSSQLIGDDLFQSATMLAAACYAPLNVGTDFDNSCTEPRWYFNKNAGACLMFIGCDPQDLAGTSNNFPDAASCVATCGGPMPLSAQQSSSLALLIENPIAAVNNMESVSMPHICLHPPMPSVKSALDLCQKMSLRFYFNPSIQGCVSFPSCHDPLSFNNFISLEDCAKSCPIKKLL